MATNILRSGVRAVVFKKKSVSSAFQAISDNFAVQRLKTQFAAPARYMGSKRNVHNSRVTALTDVESDDDGSDSEDERGESRFWRRKMRTLHNHMDINKDGVISYHDFVLLSERFANLGHLSQKEKQDFQRVLKEMWEEQWGEINEYNLVTIEKYLDEMHHVRNDKSLKKKYHHFLPYLFKAVDKDSDGEISVEEFKLFFECLGLKHDHAIVSFSHIDTNGDGKITVDEFVSLGRDFFITEDDKRPSKHFWGPLVD